MTYQEMTALLQYIGSWVWGPPTWALLGLCGAYLSHKTNWFQITKFGHYCKNTIGKLFSGEKVGDGDITPFQAFNTAMAATMGVGTLVGTTTAIVFGGPGAIFWMWAIGFFGITTKFAEITLAVHYREKNAEGMILGGPMQYISKGLGWKWLAVIFSIAGSLAAFGIGNLVQAGTVARIFNNAYGIPQWVTGIVLIFLVGVVIIGGLKRLAKVAEMLIPFFALFMMIFCATIIVENIGNVPNALSLIVVGAFTYQSAVGGFAGAAVSMAVRFGLMRGIFSNEAGLGSAPIAHATAKVDHPCKQGLWGAFEVFLDTHVMCTFVALALLTSGAYTAINPETGAGFGAEALFLMTIRSSMFGEQLGNLIGTLTIFGFAYTTILGWAFYGEKCLEYLFGTKSNIFYRIVYLPPIFVGALGIVPVWAVADILNATMAIPNLIGLLGLSGVFAALTKSYFKGEKWVQHDENPSYYKNYKD